MTATPIRNLALMLDTVSQRQSALDDAQQRDDLSNAEWAPASRGWCRQQQALSCAIIAEPPQNFYDVLTVLTELAGHHDLILGQGEETTPRELRDLHEMTTVAVSNCILRLAGLFPPEEEPTESQHQSLGWVSKQIEQWLPKSEGR